MMRRADPGPPAHVGPLLKEFLGSRPAFAANPIGDWSELVGEQVARHTRPKSLKKKVLVIAAHDSVWKHHLEQYKEVLAERINGGRAETVVEEIVIRVAEIPESAPVLNPAHKSLEKIKAKKGGARKKAKNPLRKLTPEEQKLLKSLPDPDLRELGAKLLRRIPLEE
ncbi:MAG: DUF721 domain-containing protein [Syntrophobacteraceae bacterium]